MSELKDTLIKHSFQFKKQFGQNFISDGNLLKSIVDASEIDENTTVVEVGCGAGTLTRALAERAKRCMRSISIEICNPFWRKRLRAWKTWK